MVTTALNDLVPKGLDQSTKMSSEHHAATTLVEIVVGGIATLESEAFATMVVYRDLHGVFLSKYLFRLLATTTQLVYRDHHGVF